MNWLNLGNPWSHGTSPATYTHLQSMDSVKLLTSLMIVVRLPCANIDQPETDAMKKHHHAAWVNDRYVEMRWWLTSRGMILREMLYIVQTAVLPIDVVDRHR